ncbi:hypothetical protein GPECTOR_4g779 [Gonium pectorale]|uniref:t-SNARE coiled-coil homology domain-containing protein n=1 Tax=Gonium pectorale TaxID=33097 RepID=A0A150GY03_GONPE|nr:hypothetical protein GPECTOR_4g779 [Gonium pectorale]|eukprot:KXZ54711.1 hypothetical protein GPECTOR_4g779 [Gonium pectorale]
MAPKKKEEPKEEPAAAAAEVEYERTEQEEQCERMFKELDKAFKKLHKTSKPEKLHQMTKDITNMLKEAKGLIKDFEREARADNWPPGLIAARKKLMAAQLNGFIAMKKEFADSEGNKMDLLNGAQGEIEPGLDGMSMQQLMTKGRKDIGEIDKTLDRAQRIAEETRDVGRNLASTVGDQTKQLEGVVDQLNEIEFTMKKASKIIGDITRGLLTDKCIAFLLLLVVVGVVAIIVVKIINPNRKKIQQGAEAIVSNVTTAINNTNIGSSAISATTGAINTATDAVSGAVSNAANTVSNTNLGRRMLLTKLISHLLVLNDTLY